MPSLVALDFRSKKATQSDAPTSASLYTDLLTDTLYSVDGTAVKPWFSSSADAQTAVWRSRVVVLDDQPSFAWARVEGPSSSGVLRIYGDGALFYTTPTISTNNPVRIKAGRFREWELEFESATRATDITLASSAAEMARA